MLLEISLLLKRIYYLVVLEKDSNLTFLVQKFNVIRYNSVKSICLLNFLFIRAERYEHYNKVCSVFQLFSF